jgi:DNA-binding NarL/FixJ family response regulator
MSTTTAPATKRKQRVFVVDDHPIVRQGLALLINQEPDLTVCGEAEEAESILASIVQLEPDIIVLDISLPGSDGIDALKAIRSNHADLPVLILSMHDESIYAERALRAGANGYIMKQEATDTVLVALRRILAGEVYISDRATSKMLQRIVARPATRQRTSVASLSDRELEVFRLIGSGLGTREIAEKLQLSAKTVESYQAHIKKKLSLPTARALVQRAIEWKISEGTA